MIRSHEEPDDPHPPRTPEPAPVEGAPVPTTLPLYQHHATKEAETYVVLTDVHFLGASKHPRVKVAATVDGRPLNLVATPDLLPVNAAGMPTVIPVLRRGRAIVLPKGYEPILVELTAAEKSAEYASGE